MNIRSNTAVMDAPQAAPAPVYRRTNSCGIAKAASPSLLRRAASPDAARRENVAENGQPPVLRAIIAARLAAQEPVAAYEKSATAEGAEHWVLALHLPSEDGLVTLQMPALSEMFQGIPELYGNLSKSEAPAEQQETALARGNASYTIFSVLAVGQEFATRNRLAGITRSGRARALYGICVALDRAMQERAGLTRSFEALQLIPNNMRIVASRLEPAGGPISAIAENYKTSSAAISQRIAGFINGPDSLCEQLAQRTARVLLTLAIRRMLREVRMGEASSDVTEASEDAEQQRAWLDECRRIKETEGRLLQNARLAMAEAEDCASRFGRTSADIRRHMLGLDTIRVLGRVECSRLHEGAGLSATIDQLDAFHSEIRERLEAIIRHAETVSETITEFQRADDTC